jgi:hypothetical protein
MRMIKPWVAGVAGAVAAISLIGAPAAAAATEIGDPCAAEYATPYSSATLFQIAAPESPLPQAAPSAGVVTKWKTNLSIPGPMFQALRVIRVTGPKLAQVVGESSQETIVSGANAFNTRIPIQAGDHLGLFGLGKEATPYCKASSPADVFGDLGGSVAVGPSVPFSESPGEARIPVSAVVEPDADGDGFGDETQDRCPQSAASQGECPTVTLDAFPIVLKRSVLLLVGASSASSVHVFGQVSWRLKPKGGAGRSKANPAPGAKTTTGLTVGLSGGTQTVTPGEVARFNIKLPKSVKRRLGRISPSESLKAKLTINTTDLAGRAVTKVLTVRLPGQELNG